MRAIVLSFMAAACLAATNAPVQAAPILAGKTIQTTYLFPDVNTTYCAPVNAVVGAGVELLNYCGFADIDFSDTNVKITTTRNAGINAVAFDGFKFFDVFGAIQDDLNAVVNAATNYAGFTAQRLAGGDKDTLLVNVANLPGLRGQIISIDIVPAAVPEPVALTLMGTGIAGLVARRRIRPRSPRS